MNNVMEIENECEMPLFWPEKLDMLEVNENILFQEEDNINTASMAAVRLHKRTGKKFKIRTNRKNGEVRIWRTK